MSLYRKVLEKMKNITGIRKERGSILVLTALLLPIMFGCLGIAYDVGNIYMHKARLQNVTDAAALAGGRAYLQSQLKTSETEHKDTYDTYTNGNSTDEEYVIGGSKTRSGNHPDADKAADDYIYKNIINLGEKVYSDKYSHYALPGLKKNGEDYINDSKIFYRIGLYEKLPLHFLPVITNKNVEIVRAGSVVVVEPGMMTTTIIPGSGGGSSTVTHTSIFDNLFTFSESLFTRNNIQSNGTIEQSFIGDMVYTHQNGLLDGDLNKSIYYESSTPGPAGDDDATNTNQNHWYETKGGAGSSSTAKINDPIIDTSFDTKAYLEAFRSKLDSFHIDVNKSQQLYTSDINNPNSSLYTQDLTIDGNTVRQKNGVLYIDSGDKDYYLADENTNSYLLVDGQKVHYVEFPKSYGQASVRCYEKDGKYYILNKNNEASDCYIDINTNKAFKGDKELWIDQQRLYIPLDEWGNNKDYINENLYDCIDRNNYFQPQNDAKYSVKVDAETCNVFHITKKRSDGQVNQSFDININDPITIGDENTPIYIIVDDIYQVKINGNASTTRRPIILVFLGEGTQQLKYEFTGAEFKGVIYAPVSGFEHVQNLTGIFRGNIITKNINIEASSKMTWIQENFLENENYTDEAIKAISDANKQKIEEANAALTDELKQKIREKLGITEEQQNSMDWYNNLRYPEKQSLFTKWKALYDEYKNDPAIRNILWPWNEHFNIEAGEDQTIITTTDELLRLINYRTEFQIKENMTNDDVLDPFIFETLAKPNSY